MATTNLFMRRTGTDFNNAASYHNGTYGAGAVPASTDTIQITEGNQHINTNVGALAAVDLAAVAGTTYPFYIGPGFTGRIHGTSNAPVEIGVDGTFCYEAGGGEVYVKPSPANITTVILNSAGGKLYLTGGNAISGSIVGQLGVLDIAEDIGLSGITIRWDGGSCTIHYKADGTDPNLDMQGGTMLCRRPFGTVNMNGGILSCLVWDEANAANAMTINGGTVNLHAGSIPTLTGKGGKLNATVAQKNLTIGGTASTWHPGIKFTRNSLVTVSNTTFIGTRTSADDNSGAPTA